MPKYSNERLSKMFEEDVSEAINSLYIKLISLFKYETGLSAEEYEEFATYWNAKVERENVELEVKV
ncbi:MAG TPA: hypothetical protein VIK78_19785 [Ruminiclostridium sp.]